MIELIVRAIIEHRGKYLLVKLLGENFWCLPGGKVEAGEDIQAALKREIIEELGVPPVIGRLSYVHQLIDEAQKSQRLEFFFEVTNGADYAVVDLSQTTHGAKELAATEFLSLHGTNLLPAFLIDELPQGAPTTQFRFTTYE